MRLLFIVNAILLVAIAATAQTTPQLNLMPMPSTVQPGTGQLTVDQSFSVSITGFHDASLDRGVQRFVSQLARETGLPLRYGQEEKLNPTLTIHADHDREKVQKLGEDESYELTISSSGANLTAPNPLGILHGLQSFLQLVRNTTNGFAAPAVTIKDQPRFAWRGLLIDVSRHFMPLEVMERNIDGMAAVKLNVLHWHLSDDQGFRVESRKFPKLHEMGSNGQYYTQAEIREFIAYAHDRGIRVVPEFDTPGHSRSWFVGYPELASGPGPYEIEPDAPPAATDPTREETYKFLDRLVGEMGNLFPDAYFHIGGDEVNGKQWDENPKIQAFIQAHGMKNNQDLQAYFNQRLQKILAKHHKNMIGWDEVLHPDLPKTIVVQSWRGQESLATAAKQGYSSLLSFGYYLDLMWPAARHYAVDPMTGGAATLSPEEKARILGGEACMWMEWVTPEILDLRLWPRTAAIAERLWSPQEVTDIASMYARTGDLSWHLAWLGLTHKSVTFQMWRRALGTDDLAALRVLADVAEPVKDYDRKEASGEEWDFRNPRNRLVDSVSPESDVARHFGDLVHSYAQSGYKDASVESQVRALLTTWRDNDARLRPMLQRSFLLQEDIPLSEALASLGAAGLQALDYLEQSQNAPEDWKRQQLAVIEAAKTPKANLLLLIADPVEQLVQASGGATGH